MGGDLLWRYTAGYGRWPRGRPKLGRATPTPATPPRWMPLPHLLSAQVVQSYRRRRVVRVRYRVVFGTLAGIKHILVSQGWQINTAFIERINLTIRQHVAAVGQHVMTLGKGEEGLRQQLALYHPAVLVMPR